MKKSGLVVTIFLLLGLLFSSAQVALAISDGYYQLSETAPAWDGTAANRLNPVSSDYDYAYGDEASVTHNLP